MLHKGYLYINNNESLALVTAEKNKGEIIILDAFSVDTSNYINENGVILFPLTFAEEISKRFNNEKYVVKDLSLIISPVDAVVSISKETYTDNLKKLGALAKSRIEESSIKHPEAYEFGWHSPGSILDDGNPYTVLLSYCYAKRYLANFSKVFSSCGLNITGVILSELAMAAVYEQYKSEFTDPDYLIIESGYVNNPNSLTTGYWYKRNMLNDVSVFDKGICSIISTVQASFPKLTKDSIREIIFDCGCIKDYATERTFAILEMNGIEIEQWYAVCKPVLDSYLSTIVSKIINKDNHKVDEIVLAGELCLIPGIIPELRDKYQLPIKCWENEYETPLAKKTLIWPKGNKASAKYSILFGAIYFDNMRKGFKTNFLPKRDSLLPTDKFFWKREPKAKHQNKAPIIIGIAGAERGAGTTTLCMELAQYLSKSEKVAILEKTERCELTSFPSKNIDIYTSNLGKIDMNKYSYIFVDFGVFYEIGKLDGLPTIITDSKTVVDTNSRMSVEMNFCKRIICVCPAVPWKLYKTDFLVNNMVSAEETADWLLFFNGDTQSDEFQSLDLPRDIIKSFKNPNYLEEILDVL